MKAIRLALLELRRFRGTPARRLVLVGLVLVPLLYGGLHLWSNWNPYGRLDEIPVAVVNSDRPVRAAGQYINAGEQFVQQLKAGDLFEWHFVDAAEAREGLEQGRYYFTITVPKNFSAKLATATQPRPQRAKLLITKNDANNYLVGIMADTAEAELQNQINSAAHAAYARAIYGKIDYIRERLQLASKTAQQLVEGTGLSEQGATGLTEGLTGLVDSSRGISRSVGRISETAEQLDSQLAEVTALTSQQLPETADALVDAADTAVRGMSTVATTTGVIADRAATGVSGLEQLAREHPELASDPTYRRVLANARELAAASAAADSEAAAALDSARQAQQRATALRDGITTLQSRVSALTTPVDTLVTGTSQLAESTETLTSGMRTLADSSRVLAEGAGLLNDGARELSGLVDESLAQIPPTNPTRVAKTASVLGSPTEITEHNLNPAGVHGRGMAPLVFAIALWVFGLFAHLLLKPVNLRALAGKVSALTVTLAGWLPAAVLGVLGALVLLTVVSLGLGLDPVRLWSAVGLLALAAATFVAIVHFLRTWLGPAGDAVSLVLLVVQLTASGGLYPMETAPAPFQAVHPLLPMTYLVDGLRITISGGLTGHLLRDVAVLGGFLVVSLALTSLAVRRQRVWTVGRLHPGVEL